MGIFNQIFGNQGFDSNAVEPAADFEVLAPGKYPVVIEKAEVKQTKSGTGVLLRVEAKVVDGPARNRLLWANLNIQNPSEVAQRIGLSQLSGLCKACGVPQCRDEQELVGKSCIASVKVKDEQNEIRAWLPCGQLQDKPPYVAPNPSPVRPTGGNGQEPPKPAGTKPPWQR